MLLKIENLSKTYKVGNKTIYALRDINLSIKKGKTLGLVGESGSGKSTIALTITKLENASSGKILMGDTNLLDLDHSEFSKYKKKLQLVLQDPYASLNPRKTAIETVREAYVIHQLADKEQATFLAIQLLNKLGVTEEHILKFPHELSGGQRQRVSIARSLAVSPSLLILDEPLSSLDVSVQAQIVELLKNLQEENDLSFLFISHDLAMVKYFCHEVAVIFQGHLMETASVLDLFENPLHPYTKLLIASIPIPDPNKEKERRKVLMSKEASCHKGSSKGCPFANRCPHATPICFEKKAEWKEVKPNHFVACHHYLLPVTTICHLKSL